MRTFMTSAVFGVLTALTATLASAPAAAVQLCDFNTYTGSPGTGFDVNWNVACEALNDSSADFAIKITGMTFRSTSTQGPAFYCSTHKYLRDWEAPPTALPTGGYEVVYYGNEAPAGKCDGDKKTSPRADVPQKSRYLETKIINLPNNILSGTSWRRPGSPVFVEEVIITADYYPNFSDTIATTEDPKVYPMILRITKPGNSDNWKLQSYEYICSVDLPPNPLCSGNIRTKRNAVGWDSYVITTPNVVGDERINEVNYKYQDGSGSVQMISWRQNCKQDSLYVQAANSHYKNTSPGIDICNCETTGSQCPTP